MPAEPCAVAEEHAGSIGGLDVELDRDGVGPVPDVRSHRFGYLGGSGVVHIPVTCFGKVGALGTENLYDATVLQRQGVFIVSSLLIYSAPGNAQSRFNERVLETLLGVAVAAIFGVAIPAWRRQAGY